MKNVEIPKWLERLPLAPEFRPTDTEFADPIAYISKIEKEASAFGICKIIPPLSKPSKKYVLHNLNKSLSKCPELGSDVNTDISSKKDSGGSYNCERAGNNAENRAVFTTRHQEVGCEKGKNSKGAKKQVWQSGEVYTIEQFESKSNKFAKSHLGMVKEVSNPLVIEAMFWKSASEKPIYVEYANDVPGSGFGEPEGSLRYFYKRKRKRRKRNSFDMNYLGNTDQVNELNSVRDNEDSNTFFSGRKDCQGVYEMEGGAGWKLSNSPWNLQVIARSIGSLTRFMPDDIPGVTSPMVYIGMLFSWFAWHVEDHELHSLNFHHMGSPKTWYSVPGDCAAYFEEAVRLHVYGKDADRLVALSLLGEKTTVLSPEVFVSSGIPCCRLVQNPGEFVVTFPRAYHIGFSHGFNCGEAANFGTPKWLTIAKEAAVRRAAMNYLPMLSHQQLLHLLTMSFISKIPRSLLPGVRSSRFRDRQKEERELLVKRAFIEDILHENRLLTDLLQRDSSYRAVLWDVESMPCSNKASELNKFTDDALLKSTRKNSPKNAAADNMCDVNQLNEDYICAIGFDLNDDGLPYDFQIESGSLPCVACGILGFPFMAVLQPSDVALINIPTDHGDMVEFAEDAAEQATLSKKVQLHVNEVSSNSENKKGWNISTASLKPRFFCLEHALEVEELLNSIGGANVLVICHSDFQKIKSHAASIAEEVALPFNYIESPLGNASSKDLKLIDLAMGIEERADPAQQDWTSELSINLKHCVKVRKSCPSKNVKHLLNLGGLFCDASFPVPNSSAVKWLSRKFRSKRHLNKKPVLPLRLSDSSEIIEDFLTASKDVKIIQYSRKRYKSSVDPTDTCLAVSDILYNVDRNDPDEEGMKNNNSAICVGQGRIGNSWDNSETVCLTLDENRINCAAEIKISREEEMVNESVVASEIFDLVIENEHEEDSGPCILSNCLDNNGSPSKFVEKMEAISDGDKPEGVASRPTELINASTSFLLEEHLDEARVDTRSQTDIGNNILSAEKEVLDDLSTDQSELTAKTGSKRKREMSLQSKAEQFNFAGFIRSPCEGLRSRAKTSATGSLTTNNGNIVKETPKIKRSKIIKGNKMGRYMCELDGCDMSFQTKAELNKHNENRCLVKGCGKTFNSHKYTVQHKRVHDDERPLKCTWKGCTMSFKWAWARIEHLRVHTGEKPYACKVNGCGLTFRYVSDFSRHRRKTGHYADRLP